MGIKFIRRNPSDKNFYNTVKIFAENTTTFENSTIMEKYKNDKLKKVNETTTNLFFAKNPIFDKYLHRILEKCTMITVTAEQKERWDMNPYLASKEIYNTPEYWWILLLANRMTNIYEFCKLPDTIYKADIEDLMSELRVELQKNEDMGMIKE